MAANFVQIENDSEIKQRLEAERARVRKIAGLDPPKHFHRQWSAHLPRNSGPTPPSCSAASRVAVQQPMSARRTACAYTAALPVTLAGR